MKCHYRLYVVVCVSMASLLVLCDRAAGFNPQPEPPATWRVEGFIDMLALAVDPTGEEMPFGIDPDIVGDDVVDFRAGVIARFHTPVGTVGRPPDGLYDAEFEYFRLRIGDTTWDETMTRDCIQFQVTGGVVSGCFGRLTDTMPTHPDLSFALPASPGTWEALDMRGDVNLGVLKGTYELRDGAVPEPATIILMGLGAVCLLAMRRLRR